MAMPPLVVAVPGPAKLEMKLLRSRAPRPTKSGRCPGMFADFAIPASFGAIATMSPVSSSSEKLYPADQANPVLLLIPSRTTLAMSPAETTGFPELAPGKVTLSPVALRAHMHVPMVPIASKPAKSTAPAVGATEMAVDVLFTPHCEIPPEPYRSSRSFQLPGALIAPDPSSCPTMLSNTAHEPP